MPEVRDTRYLKTQISNETVPPGIPADVYLEVMRMKHLSDLKRADATIERWNRERRRAFAKDFFQILGSIFPDIAGAVKDKRYLRDVEASTIIVAVFDILLIYAKNLPLSTK